jgi:hypothetical protein
MFTGTTIDDLIRMVEKTQELVQAHSWERVPEQIAMYPVFSYGGEQAINEVA